MLVVIMLIKMFSFLHSSTKVLLCYNNTDLITTQSCINIKNSCVT